MIDWTKYPNFERHELECKCGCGQADMDPDFMQKLQELRSDFSIPFVITSGFRCRAHNERLRGGPAHPSGKAVDISIRGIDRYFVLKQAFKRGFTGIGCAKTFIHLDTLAQGETPAPRPSAWGY